ncbi:MAG: NAD(P)-dependent oxidoreductase [Actinomycetota bacterium]|nr:NAD(P)-dependent oxidoreductase [Actinomycetota bacterium]
MIIADRALEERAKAGDPVRVAMIGAGFMGRGIALQIVSAVPGMRLVAIANRTLEKAREAFALAGAEDVVHVESEASLSAAIAGNRYAITEDPLLLARQPEVEAVIEVTGAIEDAALAVLTAIEHGKHVILMNAELDGTIGPILKTYADRAGVVYTNADGDQPGVQLNLYRFVKGIGVRPLLCGNIKGLHDPYRNPTTQEGFARQWGQNPWMVTSFADGTKISFEQAIVANATGMQVATRGMHGPSVEGGTHIDAAKELFPLDDLVDGPGIVDYVVGAVPSPGVFVLGTHGDAVQRHYLNLYKLGEGPLYCFYTPWHLCHFEVPNTVARAVLLGDATIAPLGAPMVDVVAAAKVALEAGQELDALGGYLTYGLAENADVAAAERLLPIGLAAGCRVTRAVAKDELLGYDDVEVPEGRLADRLRAEQNERFAPLPA